MSSASGCIIDSNLTTRGMGTDLALVTWVGRGCSGTVEDAAGEAYASIAASLRERGCVPVQERAFGDLHAAPSLARGRERAVGNSADWAVPTTYVEGSPVGRAGLSGIHVVAARGASRLLAEGDRVFGRVVEGETARVVGLADTGRRSSGGPSAGPAEDAVATLQAAEELLAREGLSFRDVARTWFYLRDILDWYGPFNTVRNAAFRRMGLMGPKGSGLIPASTGIEGRNPRGGWCTLDLLALQAKGGGPAPMERLHNRRQNEATEYGSAFARAMEVVLGDARYVFVSGTASIDDRGATVHAGDFETQTRFTIEAVEALLEGAGAGLRDVAQATAFLKNPCDARAFERVIERSSLDGAPLVTTVADVCRNDLLFEIDAVAVVPLDREARP
jgi:enamine deaminase RidA (YjgF/YER057c/UK114 family)